MQPNGLLSSKAVLHARVSSKDQENEGYSIPAQWELLRGYARAHGFDVLKEFTDVETAKAAGRTSFGEMIALLGRASPAAPCWWKRPTASTAT